MRKLYFVKPMAKVNRHAHAWPAFVKFCKRVTLQRALIRKLLTCYNLAVLIIWFLYGSVAVREKYYAVQSCWIKYHISTT